MAVTLQPKPAQAMLPLPPIAVKPKVRRKPGTTAGPVATTEVEVKPLVKHVLSKELQLYYERVSQAVLSRDDILRGFALTSLSQDPGLHQLVPYFVQFVAEKITRNLKDTFILDCILDMLQAMLNNSNLFIEPYVRQQASKFRFSLLRNV
ncbi:MAG: hypothetical protein BJ554DRAFT_5951 [Olpidium bornovanus]|uniref:TAF6 C-terminal HEAT repeat domain-containing protein n=1 Tax=Olpidium bornovanus TaxID=278681 RepID=A0A8H7ZYK2_9FUNG|nr:MAG: hypothetical protein BJ554DRAFT_5951 [Olpidium bornovanus]